MTDLNMNDTNGPARITVIGAGYLGLTHAAGLAEFGHDVLAVDTDARKVARAASGIVPFFEPWLVMDLETADLVKMSANAFLATRLSFINALAEVCETTGADVVALAGALARDERIGGHFLTRGTGLRLGMPAQGRTGLRVGRAGPGHRIAGHAAHRGRCHQHALPDTHGRSGPGTRRRLAGRLSDWRTGHRV